MQLSQLLHATIGLVMIGVILGHIYIGSLGMEGAFTAMGSGQVDENWAREHHSLWLADLERKAAAKKGAEGKPESQPAE
jgi:formate dehydrogenase subunit gamma